MPVVLSVIILAIVVFYVVLKFASVDKKFGLKEGEALKNFTQETIDSVTYDLLPYSKDILLLGKIIVGIITVVLLFFLSLFLLLYSG